MSGKKSLITGVLLTGAVLTGVLRARPLARA
jgi:hypothetical protein